MWLCMPSLPALMRQKRLMDLNLIYIMHYRVRAHLNFFYFIIGIPKRTLSVFVSASSMKSVVES